MTKQGILHGERLKTTPKPQEEKIQSEYRRIKLFTTSRHLAIN